MPSLMSSADAGVKSSGATMGFGVFFLRILGVRGVSVDSAVGNALILPYTTLGFS